VYCQECNAELKNGTTTCYVCGKDIVEEENNEWILVGMIEDKISADFAHEALESYGVPSVVISKSGFFGNIGLPLATFHTPGVGLFEISVPENFAVEAANILDMVLGEKWQKKEKN
jgi:hypothetical protein